MLPRNTSVFLTLLSMGLLPVGLHAQLYWDTNGATTGAATSGVASGTWDTTTGNWTSTADGTSATTTYTVGQSVVFSAGSDTTSATINVSSTTLFSTLTPISLTVNAGASYTFTGSQISALSTIDIQSGASVAFASVRFNGASNPIITVNGTVTATDITSNGTLTMNGSGTLTSNGKLDGSVILNGGTISVNGGSKTKAVTINAGTFKIAGSNTVIDSYNIATSTGGTLELSANVTDTINNLTGSGAVTGGTGSVLTIGGGNGSATFSGTVGGALSFVKSGTGSFTYGSGASVTTTGNTTVSGGTFTLADGATMTFTIGANGVNNAILGTGLAALDGAFTFNLGGADLTSGNSWLIIDVGSLSESFASTFAVTGFTESGNVWTNGSGFTFDESTGILSYAAIPEPSTFTLLAGLGVLLTAIRRRRPMV